MSDQEGRIYQALRDFAAGVSKKMAPPVQGEPEDQLRAPFEALVTAIGAAVGKTVVAKGEPSLAGRIGKPDYAVFVDGILAGYAELKAPGKGANPDRYKGHDNRQWQRFQAIPNLLYTDGNEWGLFRSGEKHGPVGCSGVLGGLLQILPSLFGNLPHAARTAALEKTFVHH